MISRCITPSVRAANFAADVSDRTPDARGGIGRLHLPDGGIALVEALERGFTGLARRRGLTVGVGSTALAMRFVICRRYCSRQITFSAPPKSLQRAIQKFERQRAFDFRRRADQARTKPTCGAISRCRQILGRKISQST